MGIRRDDDDFDEDDEDEEDNEEGEDGDEDESGFGEDIGDGYGNDTIDPLDAQERAEAGEDQQERSSDKEKGEENSTGGGQKVMRRVVQGLPVKRKIPIKTLAVLIAKKHPFTMTSHVEARCIFCHKKSIVRSKKMYMRTGFAIVNIFAHKRFTAFYCVNPKCKMSFQRDYVQLAAGIAYEGAVVPVREILKVSKT